MDWRPRNGPSGGSRERIYRVPARLMIESQMISLWSTLAEGGGCRRPRSSQYKRPRSSPKTIDLSPGESVRIQDHKTLHWTKRAKVVRRRGPRSYVLKSGARIFIRNVRFIKRDPIAEDTEQTDFAREAKDENENHSKVRGSNPANGPVTRSRSFRRSLPRTSSN